MSNLFLTSDTHFGHANIIKYCNRPFKNLDHMDKELIKRWNERVKPSDVVLHLGDFSFKNTPGGKQGEGSSENRSWDYLKQLNGNIVILKGNHDRNNGINSHIKSLVVEFSKMDFYLTHRPDHANENYAINLIGHIHEKWLWKYYEYRHPIEKKEYKTEQIPLRINKSVILINVGMDVHNFYPIKMTEILRIISRIKKGIIKSGGFITENINKETLDLIKKF